MLAELTLSGGASVRLFSEKALCAALRHLGNEEGLRKQSSALFEGFSASQWAAYAKQKSKIASSVCRANGWLKAQLDSAKINEVVNAEAASILEGRMSDEGDYGNTGVSVSFADRVINTMPLAPQSVAKEPAHCHGSHAATQEANGNDDAPLNEDGRSCVAPGESTAPEELDNVDASKAQDSRSDPQEAVAEPKSPLYVVGRPLDVPGKSWDLALFTKLSRALDEDESTQVCLWLKARYLAKEGKSTMNLGKAAMALSNIEVQAALQYCRSHEPRVLDISVYTVHLPDNECECESQTKITDGEYNEDQHHHKMLGVSAPSGLNDHKVMKIAGISKRGMAQPRKSKR